MRKGFTVHHNGPPARCVGQPHSRCISFWEAVRAFHTNPKPVGKGWSDIAYSHGVCPHGIRFTGRGWYKSQFANGTDVVGVDNGPNSAWYSVLVFVGGGAGTGYPEEKPTVAQMTALRALVQEGRANGLCGLEIKPHNDWKPKPCPGPTLVPWCRTWDGKTFATSTTGDDMSADDVKAINAHLDHRLVRFASWLTTGRGNALIAPDDDDVSDPWDFADDADTSTLNELRDLLENGDRWSLLTAHGVEGAFGERLTALEQSQAEVKDALAHITEMLHEMQGNHTPENPGS